MKVVTLALALALTFVAVVPARARADVMVLVDVVAKAGKRAEVVAALRRSQARCPDWIGCRRFEIGVSLDDDHRIVLLELWDSVERHKAEVAEVMASERFAAFRALLAQDLAFRYLRVQPAAAPTPSKRGRTP